MPFANNEDATRVEIRFSDLSEADRAELADVLNLIVPSVQYSIFGGAQGIDPQVLGHIALYVAPAGVYAVKKAFDLLMDVLRQKVTSTSNEHIKKIVLYNAFGVPFELEVKGKLRFTR